MRLGRFFGELWATFFDNATSKRDFRSQLRGPRSMWIWFGYLVVLSVITVISYGRVSGGSMNIMQAQSELKGLYASIVGTIAALMLLIVPAMTATSVIAERDRKSLDLLQSAPVSPTYLLVGKLMHTMRFGLILVMLTAPFAGIAILAGGATWQEVVLHFFMILFSVSFYAAIALAISSQAHKAGAALALSFTTIAVIVLLASTGDVVTMFSRPGGPVGRAVYVGPWFLSPFFSATASALMDLFDPAVMQQLIQNFGIGLLFMTFVILGAASALSRYGSTETKVFRVLCLSSVLVCSVLWGGGAAAGISGMMSSGTKLSELAWGLLLIPTFMVPFACTWRAEGERKTLFDGLFNVRRLMIGSPSGGLPFVFLTYVLGWVLLILTAGRWATYDDVVAARFFWGLGNILFLAGICGWTSSIASSIGNARGLAIVAMIVLALLPLMLLASGGFTAYSVMGLYGGLSSSQMGEIVTSSVLQSVLGVLLLYFSSQSAQHKMQRGVINHAKPPRAA